jgi:hypothetical protein
MAVRILPITATLAAAMPANATSLKIPAGAASFISQMSVGDTVYIEFRRAHVREVVAYTATGPVTPLGGYVTLAVERGQLGTVPQAWPAGSCGEAACCHEEITKAMVLDTGALQAAAANAASAVIPPMLSGLVQSQLPAMLSGQLAGVVAQGVATQLPAAIAIAMQSQVPGMVNTAVASQISTALTPAVTAAVTTYLNGHLSAEVAELMSQHACCQPCDAPRIVVPLCPHEATVGTFYDGMVRFEDVNELRNLTLPAWASHTLDVSAQTLRIYGTPTYTAALNWQATLVNNCGPNPNVVFNVPLGPLTVGGAVVIPQPCATPSVPNPLSPAIAEVGVPYTGTIRFADATAITLAGLPTWATATTNYTTGLITVTGTPPASGDVVITASATNACAGGLASSVAGLLAGHLALTEQNVNDAPVIQTPLAPATIERGQAYTGTIFVANATEATVVNLPAWAQASYTAQNGGILITISGTPPAAQVVNFLIDATNGSAGGLPSSLDDATGGALTVTAPNLCPAPMVTSTITPASAQVAVPYSGTIMTTNATSASVPGLPTWATQAFDAATGAITISGTPTVSGALALSVNMENACAGGSPSSAVGAPGGMLNMAAQAACPTPFVSQPLTPAVATQHAPFTGTIVVSNATSASLVTMDPWMTPTYQVQGSQVIITVTGTPPNTQAGALNVSAVNACSGMAQSSSNNMYSGMVTPCAAPSLGDQLTDCNGVAVGVMLVPQPCDAREFVELTNCEGVVVGYMHPTQTVQFSNPVEVCSASGSSVLGWIYPA